MTSGDFELTPAERAVTGVSVRHGQIIVRPTAPAIAGAVLMIVIGGTFMIVGGIETAVLMRLLGLYGACAVAAGWRSASARVTADARGLEVRNHWATKHVRWDEVSSIAPERVRRRWGYLPYSAAWNGPREFVLGTIITRDGRRIACDALASVAEKAGTVAAEIKTGIVVRWAQEHGLPNAAS